MLGLSRSGFCFRKSRTSARSWGRSKKTAPTTWTRTTTTPTAANLERNFDSTVVGRRRRLSVVTVDAAVVAVVVVALVVVVAQIPDFRRFRNRLDLQLPVFHDRSQAPAVVAGVEPKVKLSIWMNSCKKLKKLELERRIVSYNTPTRSELNLTKILRRRGVGGRIPQLIAFSVFTLHPAALGRFSVFPRNFLLMLLRFNDSTA